jgi:RNase adapter protein RapZ
VPTAYQEPQKPCVIASAESPKKESKVHLVVVTGTSGSGKSTAIKAFEDIGYFCIDNLPVPLLPHFLGLCAKEMHEIEHIALGIDIRERKFLSDYDNIFKSLEQAGYRFEIIFLEAPTDVLQRRFSQTRRLHPLASSEANLLDAIHSERQQLQALRERASRILDTGMFSVHQLKHLLIRTYSLMGDRDQLKIQVLSFGFKYGLPFEADMVMDVRFLPNPYFVEELRALDGRTPEVRDWVLKWRTAQEFLQDYAALLQKLLPCYVEEGKRYLTVAVGCTGGKHRSVVIAEDLAHRLQGLEYNCTAFHRDLLLE